jgi:divalent metal cation (Fe/Co/Zn/Cd) transporter
MHPVEMKDPKWNYIVLGSAFIFESISFSIALRSFHAVNPLARTHFWKSLILSKDPGIFLVLFEDGAALCGLIIAGIGVYCSHALGLPELDGVASILIGLMLAVVAIFLIIESRHLLVGESANRRHIAGVCSLLTSENGVSEVKSMKTMHLGPQEILLVAKLRSTEKEATNIPRLTLELEKKITGMFPDIREIYLEFC